MKGRDCLHVSDMKVKVQLLLEGDVASWSHTPWRSCATVYVTVSSDRF